MIFQAKLLPPALAECYKILTSDSVTQRPPASGTKSESAPPAVDEKTGDAETATAETPVPDTLRSKPGGVTDGKPSGVSITPNGNAGSSPNENAVSDKPAAPPVTDKEASGTESEDEEDDPGLNLSQDEHGNYFIDMNVVSSPKVGAEVAATTSSPFPKPKSNVMLPKRSHGHLDAEKKRSPQASQTEVKTAEKDEAKKPGVSAVGICNICGRTFTGKAQDFWHTLTSPLSGFESITVTVALKVSDATDIVVVKLCAKKGVRVKERAFIFL